MNVEFFHYYQFELSQVPQGSYQLNWWKTCTDEKNKALIWHECAYLRSSCQVSSPEHWNRFTFFSCDNILQTLFRISSFANSHSCFLLTCWMDDWARNINLHIFTNYSTLTAQFNILSTQKSLSVIIQAITLTALRFKFLLTFPPIFLDSGSVWLCLVNFYY